MEDLPINATSEHEVASWVKRQVDSSKLKPCENLKVLSSRTFEGGKVFYPDCERNSFQWREPPYNAEMGVMMRTQWLHQEPIACPVNCVFFVDRRVELSKRHRAEFRAKAAHLVKLPFQWFSALSWQIQALIILLILAAISPRWMPQVINLLNAAHGK